LDEKRRFAWKAALHLEETERASDAALMVALIAVLLLPACSGVAYVLPGLIVPLFVAPSTTSHRRSHEQHHKHDRDSHHDHDGAGANGEHDHERPSTMLSKATCTTGVDNDAGPSKPPGRSEWLLWTRSGYPLFMESSGLTLHS
jgi:hypothetical protein